MDAVRTTISTVAAQFTVQEKKGMFVAVATPISAALFALIGYAQAKANAKALSIHLNSNVKSMNSQIKLIKQKVLFNSNVVQLAESKWRESSDASSAERKSIVQMLSNQILKNQLDNHDQDQFDNQDVYEPARNMSEGNMFDIYSQQHSLIKNHIIKLAFVGAILPAAILALYEKGAATPATETLQVISDLGAKALRNRGTSICLIVLLIAAKRFHNKAEKNRNTYLDELSKTGKHLLRITGFGKRLSRASLNKTNLREYSATSTTEQPQNWQNEYPNAEPHRNTGWSSWLTKLTNWNSRRGSEE